MQEILDNRIGIDARIVNIYYTYSGEVIHNLEDGMNEEEVKQLKRDESLDENGLFVIKMINKSSFFVVRILLMGGSISWYNDINRCMILGGYMNVTSIGIIIHRICIIN